MKKIIIFLALLMFVASVAYAKKGFVPLQNQTSNLMGCADGSNSNELELLNCDGSGNLLVSVAPIFKGAYDSGVEDIPNAGILYSLQMPALVLTGTCVFQASYKNVGAIYIGGSTVTNSSGINEGIRLNQNASIELSTSNLDEVYVSTDNAGDDIKWLCN